MDTNLGSEVRPNDIRWSAIHFESEEWSIVEYLLHLHTRTSRVKLKQAWHISPTHVLSNFNKRSEGRLILYSFVDTLELQEDNTIQQICRRGFKVDESGMKFFVGNFSVPGLPLMHLNEYEYLKDEHSSQKLPKNLTTMQIISGERQIHEYLICEICVGRSYVIDKDTLSSKFALPPEYDSALIAQTASFVPCYTLHKQIFDDPKDNEENDENAVLGVLPQYTFNYEYIVYSSSQVLPRYLIQFECDPSYDEVFAVPFCDNCQNAPSLIWCQSDKAKLCQQCDQYLHSQNRVVSRHIRVPINERNRSNGYCKFHANEICDSFCIACELPVCQVCIPKHLHVDASNHSFFDKTCQNGTIIPLEKVFKAELEQSKTRHPILQARKDKLDELLSLVDEKIDQVQENISSVEGTCYSLLENTMSQLQHLAELKMSCVLSDQIESQRQLDQINWAEEFFDFVKRIHSPADLLSLALSHSRARDEMDYFCFSDGNLSKNTIADMQLEGRIDIQTISAKLHADQHKMNN